GPPAANRNYRVELYLKRRLFTAQGFERYNFAIQQSWGRSNRYGEDNVDDTPIEPLVREGLTNAEGKLEEALEIPSVYRDIGLLQGSAIVTVFDESGRPVVRLKPFTVPTQEVFYGIRSIDRYQSTRQPVQIPLIALDANGKVLNNVQALVRVIRHNWTTVLERDPYNSSRYRYVSQRQEITELERTMTISAGTTSLSFTPRTSGEYEVRITRPGASSYVSEFFYAYGWGDTQTSSFEVSKEGEVTIESEKTVYQSGETAKLLFKTPFPGRLLVTIERNRVLQHHILQTDQKSAQLSLKITDEFAPNIYVAATLIKPLDNGTLPLTIAYGYLPLKVEKSGTRMAVNISVAEQSRSKTKQTITIQTSESDAELTVAVVDEGILQLKAFPTPDPHGYFYQKRALQVASHSVYPLLFPDVRPKSSVAGDAALANRINPFTNKRVKLVALWSGIVRASGGKFSYTIDIPEFSGALRVMAVAYKRNVFGSAEKLVRVADPIVIASGLPRFLSPGDEALVPITLTNTTQREATARLQASGEGSVSIGEGTHTITIPPNSEKQVIVKLNTRGIGTGTVHVRVDALGETFSEQTAITVRPVAGLVKYSGTGSIKAGETQSFTLTGNFMVGTARGRLVVSKSPIAQFTKNLSSLLQYPYGCVEQTVSSVFPQLYVADLAATLNRTLAQPSIGAQATANIQEAIRKLASMQLYNGALSYWQGGTEESWFGTTYAAHFLAEASKAGYDVNEQLINRLHSYLSKKVKERNYENLVYYDRSGQLRSRTVAAKTLFYSLYVLALADKPDIATMNYYKANRDSLALDSRYLLAVAYFLAGDKASYRSLLPRAFEGEKSLSSFGGSFYSYIRDEAIALSALMDVEPENPQIGIMSKHLSEQLRASRFASTQESGMALIALGKVARRAAASSISASIMSNGQKLAEFTGNDVVLTNNLAGKTITIASSGTGTLYYYWDTEGLSADGSFRQEDSFLQVRRTFLTRSGQPVSLDNIQHNDLLVVKISLVSLNKARVENVVITDMLPAGLEIENPRISSVPEVSWIRDNTEPDYVDIRDDRIHFFTHSEGTVHHYYYLARAVSKGTFQLGPVSADAMYNGEYHSYNGAGSVRIVERGALVQ
ncbi:MAG: alpha-2-macroglobulin family protein, partial [Candidatus Kapabacteria bacterium]|nr:alpha-2-macroglobulin family protein [Candidatus Kapabacteria bacterium]